MNLGNPPGGRMNPEIKARWVRALRSGEYKQGQGRLNAGGKFCCLGVLCEIAVQDGVIERTESDDNVLAFGYGPLRDISGLPPEVGRWAGVASNNPVVKFSEWHRETISLAELNDHSERGLNFNQIADIIEEQL